MAKDLESQTCTVEEAAKIIGVGRTTAYAGVREGSIPSLRIGRRIVVPISRLQELLHGQPQDAA